MKGIKLNMYVESERANKLQQSEYKCKRKKKTKQNACTNWWPTSVSPNIKAMKRMSQ